MIQYSLSTDSLPFDMVKRFCLIVTHALRFLERVVRKGKFFKACLARAEVIFELGR